MARPDQFHSTCACPLWSVRARPITWLVRSSTTTTRSPVRASPPSGPSLPLVSAKETISTFARCGREVTDGEEVTVPGPGGVRGTALVATIPGVSPAGGARVGISGWGDKMRAVRAVGEVRTVEGRIWGVGTVEVRGTGETAGLDVRTGTIVPTERDDDGPVLVGTAALVGLGSAIGRVDVGLDLATGDGCTPFGVVTALTRVGGEGCGVEVGTVGVPRVGGCWVGSGGGDGYGD